MTEGGILIFTIDEKSSPFFQPSTATCSDKIKLPQHWFCFFRLFIMAEPSKVIHVRNVGHEISEALLQMQDIASAVNALQFYTNVQPSIRSLSMSSRYSLSNCNKMMMMMMMPNRILLVTIHHMLYPITVEVLHQVFSPHGFVEKIVTFQKSAGFQALIQYQLHQSAISARNSLQLPKCFLSSLDELQVNHERSRDFTNPSLPSEQKGKSSQPGYGDTGMYAHAVGFPQFSLYLLAIVSRFCHHPLCAYLEDNGRVITLVFGQTASSIYGDGQCCCHRGCLWRWSTTGISGTNDRCTVLVSNLNPDRIDEDKLFNLFSIYGNIIRIKLLRNKPDHALVQMGDGFQAELAVHFLKGAMLFGKRLEVNFSKHPNITTGADTHEYSNSNLNRFNRNAAKNYRYCCSPTKMIHISTLPQDVTEEEIITHLEEHGTIVSTKLFEMNGKKQALVLFENEEQATEALVCKHATSLSGSTIRISFSQLQTI
ncbi:UNVERIFIED_CONTAM: Polypyrimidine tract-binding protein3 [Sesamum radiatum]|uniref:Polypyrimidine tract-binding protein3 n=1 Tax=Sesamum radiatum TaxID=300843 RepID=A0AAW2NU37_SESRA